MNKGSKTATESVLKALSPKQREVIAGRFGLEGGKEGKTLAAIGDKLGLTRERVRQIEKSALDSLRSAVKESAELRHLISDIKKEIDRVGGVIGREKLLAISGMSGSQLDFLAEASGEFHFYAEDEKTSAFYYLTKNDLEKALDFMSDWVRHLNSNKAKVMSGSYGDYLKEFIRTKKIEKGIAENYLGLSKMIHRNAYGDIGLSLWPEVRPATTRDRAYLVLKKKNKPLHFEELTKEINDAGLSAQLALAPTVHNELIKDTRFVLVGRGMYALREQGYEPGVAKDVIKRVLKKNGPLSQKQIIDHVNEERFFRPNTIVINLQNKNMFERMSDGRYKVRES